MTWSACGISSPFTASMLQGPDALGIGIITNPEVLVLDPETKAVLAGLEGPKP